VNRTLAGDLVECLALTGSPEMRLHRLKRLSRREWESTLSWLDLSGLSLAFWDRLTSLGAADAIPLRAGTRLARNLADHRLRVAAMMEEFNSLNRRFECAGIEYAVWKGFSLIPQYCTDPCLRASYDYDYLISEDARDRAEKVLQAAGYLRKPSRGPEHHTTFLPPNFPARPAPLSGGLYAATLPRKVELHVRLWDEQAFRIPLNVPARPLDRRLLRTSQGLAFYSLGDEDALMFQALHAFQHILHNWCRLGWLREIAYFLERQSADTSFWTRFHAHLAGDQPLTEVVALVFTLASRLFHTTLPLPIKGPLLGSLRPQVSLWVDQYGLCSAFDNFAENKYTLFLYRELVRDEAVWQEIRKNRLLPLHRPNHAAGVAAPATFASLPASWRQGWYVVRRLIHHSVGGARYAWESARWQRIKTRAGRPILSSLRLARESNERVIR